MLLNHEKLMHLLPEVGRTRADYLRDVNSFLMPRPYHIYKTYSYNGIENTNNGSSLCDAGKSAGVGYKLKTAIGE